MIRGSCLCQAVKYEISNAPLDMTNCHCSMCRKTHGAAFATYARILIDSFRFLSGKEQIAYYNSSPPVKRAFCSACGSQIIFLHDKTPEILWVTAGTFDDDPVLKPYCHIFVSSKAPWFDIADNLPQHNEYPEKIYWKNYAPAIGCVVGGCLIPLAFFVYCATVLNNMGGPGFWPIMMLFFAIIGLSIGLLIKFYPKQTR